MESTQSHLYIEWMPRLHGVQPRPFSSHSHSLSHTDTDPCKRKKKRLLSSLPCEARQDSGKPTEIAGSIDGKRVRKSHSQGIEVCPTLPVTTGFLGGKERSRESSSVRKCTEGSSSDPPIEHLRVFVVFRAADDSRKISHWLNYDRGASLMRWTEATNTMTP